MKLRNLLPSLLLSTVLAIPTIGMDSEDLNPANGTDGETQPRLMVGDIDVSVLLGTLRALESDEEGLNLTDGDDQILQPENDFTHPLGINDIDSLAGIYFPTKFTADQMATFFKESRLETDKGVLIPDNTFNTSVAPRGYHVISGYAGPIADKIQFTGRSDVTNGKFLAHYTYTSFRQVIEFTIEFQNNGLGFVNLSEDSLGKDNPFERPTKPIKDSAWLYLLSQGIFFEDTYGHSQQRLNGNVMDILFLTHQFNKGSIFHEAPANYKQALARRVALGKFCETNPELSEEQLCFLTDWCFGNKPIDFKDARLLGLEDIEDRTALEVAFKRVLWIEFFYAQGYAIPEFFEDLGRGRYAELLKQTWRPLLSLFKIDAATIPADLTSDREISMKLVNNKAVYVFKPAE